MADEGEPGAAPAGASEGGAGDPPSPDGRTKVIALVAGAVVVALLVGAVVLATRDGDDEDAADTASTTTESTSDPTEPSTSEGSSTASTAGPGPSTATTPSPPTTAGGGAASGEPGPGCVDGWTTPAPGTDRRSEPLDAIREQMGVAGQFEVLDMRYFTGPEVPEIVSPRPPFIEWWYVKARLVDDPSFQARWLVVRRSAQVSGIASVATFGSQGFRSPDWLAFIGEGTPREVPGIPGLWVGLQYDFVTGEPNESPGLPVENRRCLDGT